MTTAHAPQNIPGVEGLVTRACERAGLDDFGGDSWREGLALLVQTVESAPGVNAGGRDFVYGQFVDALWNRLRVVDYLRQHPEVAAERIERPLVVLGLPRTGTSLASYLLDQDPNRRSLLTWEAENSVPPPSPETLRIDPRCLKKKAELEALAEGLKAANIPMVHWDDADGPTECMFVQNQDFRAYLWEAFMPTSAYADWLMDADMTSTYAYERSVLQMLQSRAPGVWSLKMPSHAVHIDALLSTFPDVRIVWAHRDPFKATASFLRLNYLSRAVLGDEIDVTDVVSNVLRQLQAHVARATASAAAHRRRPVLRFALRRSPARSDRCDALTVRVGRGRTDAINRRRDASVAETKPAGPLWSSALFARRVGRRHRRPGTCL